MQDLYTRKTYDDLNARVTRRYVVLGVVCGLLLAAALASAIVSPPIQWLTMVSIMLAGILAIFVIDLFILPLVRYRRLIRGAISGRSHTRTAEFVSMDQEISMVDGVACRAMYFLGDPDKHGSREQLFYWDNQLPLPDLVPGREYEIKYTGKNIIAI